MGQNGQGINAGVETSTVMSPRIPERLGIAGFLIFVLLQLKICFRHDPFPGEASFNSICQVIMACLLSASVFFGLYGFCVSPTVKRVFLLYCLGCGFALVAQLYISYSEYSVISRLLNQYANAPRIEILTQAVAKTRDATSEAVRANGARASYMMFGVELPYRKQDLTWTYYEPNAQDKETFENVRDIDAAMLTIRQEAQGILAGAVNVVFYSFITFLFGLLWLALKKPVQPNTE